MIELMVPLAFGLADQKADIGLDDLEPRCQLRPFALTAGREAHLPHEQAA